MIKAKYTPADLMGVSVQALAAFVFFLFIFLQAIPFFASRFVEYNSALPLFTRLTIASAHFLQRGILLIILFTVLVCGLGAVLAFFQGKKEEAAWVLGAVTWAFVALAALGLLAVAIPFAGIYITYIKTGVAP